MKRVLVINRTNCSVSYEIPEMRVSRVFRAFGTTGDRMEIADEELKALSYRPGGRILIESYLLIKDEEMLAELALNPEPEYFYTEDEIKKLLKSGSMNQLLDCLEFAPDGVKELIKKVSIETRLDSTEKREAISEALGVNITAMIKNDIIIKEAAANAGQADGVMTPIGRRAKPISSSADKPAATPEKPKQGRRAKPVTE